MVDHLKMDNTTALTCTNKYGGTVLPLPNQLTNGLWSCCFKREVALKCFHLPGALNNIADEESRSDRGQNGMEAVLHSVQTHPGRSVSFQTDQQNSQVCELETGSICNGMQCIQLELGGVRIGPNMESDRQSPVTNKGPEGQPHTGFPSVEITGMVSIPSGNVSEQAMPSSRHTESDSTNPQGQSTRHQTSVGRMCHHRNRYKSRGISEVASDLLLASWHQKTSSSYDSLCEKWFGWCESNRE